MTLFVAVFYFFFIFYQSFFVTKTCIPQCIYYPLVIIKKKERKHKTKEMAQLGGAWGGQSCASSEIYWYETPRELSRRCLSPPANPHQDRTPTLASRHGYSSFGAMDFLPLLSLASTFSHNQHQLLSCCTNTLGVNGDVTNMALNIQLERNLRMAD